MQGLADSSPGSIISSLVRYLYRHLGVTPGSRANSSTSSHVRIRSTAIRWNLREYRFRFTLNPSPCKVCRPEASHFKGAVHGRGHPRSAIVGPGIGPARSRHTHCGNFSARGVRLRLFEWTAWIANQKLFHCSLDTERIASLRSQGVGWKR